MLHGWLNMEILECERHLGENNVAQRMGGTISEWLMTAKTDAGLMEKREQGVCRCVNADMPVAGRPVVAMWGPCCKSHEDRRTGRISGLGCGPLGLAERAIGVGMAC